MCHLGFMVYTASLFWWWTALLCTTVSTDIFPQPKQTMGRERRRFLAVIGLNLCVLAHYLSRKHLQTRSWLQIKAETMSLYYRLVNTASYSGIFPHDDLCHLLVSFFLQSFFPLIWDFGVPQAPVFSTHREATASLDQPTLASSLYFTEILQAMWSPSMVCVASSSPRYK